MPFRPRNFDGAGGGAISVQTKVLGSKRHRSPPLRWLTQPFPSESTATSCGSASGMGSAYSTAMYFVASSWSKVLGKRLLGSGFGLAALSGAEICYHVVQQTFSFLIGQIFGKG